MAIGSGSVLDTSKFVTAMAGSCLARAADMQGKPDHFSAVVPLIAISTTVGIGSGSSPVAALHGNPHSQAAGRHSPLLVPQIAICKSDLTRTLPRHLVAATEIDALSHCLESYLSDPPNPVINALALNGLARAYASIEAALEPENDAAHAVALACGDQNLHGLLGSGLINQFDWREQL